MPAAVRGGWRNRIGQEPVGTDMAFLTVMLDVTANLLCTAIILLVLSLAVDRRAPEVKTERIPIISGPTLTPADLVAAFRLRAGSAPNVITIDVARETVTLKAANASPGMATVLSTREVFEGKLAEWLPRGENAEVLLFIFDQGGYAGVQATIDKARLPSREIDVPLALRSVGDEQAWSQGFQALYGLDLDPDAFQRRLQKVLEGGRGGNDRAGAPGRPGAGLGEGGPARAVVRFLEIVGFWWRFMLVFFALAFMVWVRRNSSRRSKLLFSK